MEQEKVCEQCYYYGRPADAPETVEEQCMYMPDEDDVDEEGDTIYVPPCMRG